MGEAQGGREKSRGRRWLVLSEDGRHGWLGRHSDPSDEEIRTAEEGLVAQSLAGWLAVSEGDFWDIASNFVLMQVKPLANPTDDFEVATAKFLERRKSCLAELS